MFAIPIVIIQNTSKTLKHRKIALETPLLLDLLPFEDKIIVLRCYYFGLSEGVTVYAEGTYHQR